RLIERAGEVVIAGGQEQLHVGVLGEGALEQRAHVVADVVLPAVNAAAVDVVGLVAELVAHVLGEHLGVDRALPGRYASGCRSGQARLRTRGVRLGRDRGTIRCAATLGSRTRDAC